MSDFDQHRRGGARRDGFASSQNKRFNKPAQNSRFSRGGQSTNSRDTFGHYERGDHNKGGNFRHENRSGGFQRGNAVRQRQQNGESFPNHPFATRQTNEHRVSSSDPWDTAPRSFERPRPSFDRPSSRPSYSKKNDKRKQPLGKRRVDYKEEAYDPNQPIRLNKYLANAGICSRRDADKYIEAGVVKVNGTVVTELGHKVLRSDEVLFHDQLIKAEKKIYVLLNKPKGYVTTSEDPQNRKTVMDLVRNACMERIYPVGRLDRNTTGVLLLTNDGEMASKLTHPKFLKKKIYHVYLDRNVTAADLRQIAEGITLEDGEIRADAIDYASDTDKKQVGIEIHSGKNRIVRRIFAALGYNVLKLDRVYFAGLTKKNVKRGDWRHLTEEEVRMLRMGAFE